MNGSEEEHGATKRLVATTLKIMKREAGQAGT